MGQSTAQRRQVLELETVVRLNEYLAFRHYYRHSDSSFRDWEELEKLVRPLLPLWDTVKNQLHAFVASLEKG